MNERRNHNVVTAHNGISTVLTLNFSAWKLKNGMNVSSAKPTTRFSRSRKSADRRHTIHSAIAGISIARR